MAATKSRTKGKGFGGDTSRYIDGRIAARHHAEKAIKVLVDIMMDQLKPAAARVTAAQDILNRAWGRPVQAVTIAGEDGGPVKYSQVMDDAERFTNAIIELAAKHNAEKSAAEVAGRTVQ